MQETYANILPKITEDSKHFWDACKRKELKLQYCNRCQKFQFPPRWLCNHCWALNLEWRTVDGKGVVYSFTVVHRSPEPAFQQSVPYVLALVDLDVGPRMMTNIIGCRPEEVKIGIKVEPAFVDSNGGMTLIKFKPTI